MGGDPMRRYVNVYRDSKGNLYTGAVFATEDEAYRYRGDEYIYTAPLDVPEEEQCDTFY
jgi:hypothetical protein